MRLAIARLKSASPLGQSKAFSSEKNRNETHDDYETRCWKERAHVDEHGQLFIPPSAFKHCIAEAAKYKGIQIPGKGKERYTKHFEAGILCCKPVLLGVHIDDVKGQRLFLPSDGKVGGSKRVWKTFPFVQQWEADVEFMVLDDIITSDVFETHLVDAGQFIGVGFFRPIRRGWWGRFSVEGITWKSL